MTRPEMSRNDLASLARESGLTLAGVTDASPFGGALDYTLDHVRSGHTRGMDWYTEERARQSADPRTLHETVKSIIAVGVPFWSGKLDPPDDDVPRGKIARYAWGRDYHKTLKRRMRDMVARIEAGLGRQVESRELVDTARVFDRAVAARAGVGWYGKNSMIIVPGHGSWVMLGAIYLDVELVADPPLDQNCGRCTICIDNCPTGAIIDQYRIDAPRCISFLTIEERGPLPHELRHLMGNWVFGCDVCQNVCPYTGAAREAPDPDFAPATVDNCFPSLEFLATMDEAAYLSAFAGTAVTRAKRRGLARNAAVALGNSRDPAAEPILRRMLHQHDEPLARGHAAWALRHLTGDEAKHDLGRAFRNEADSYVRGEIDRALSGRDQSPEPSSRNDRSVSALN